MGKYIKLFENHSGYATFINGGGVELPNVSHCIQENEVHYNQIIDYLICTYTITSSSKSTKIYNTSSPPYQFDITPLGVNMFKSIELDGQQLSISDLDTNNGSYTLEVGEHIAKFELVDSTEVQDGAFYQCTDMTNVVLPKGIKNIGRYAFGRNTKLNVDGLTSNIEEIGYYAFWNVGTSVLTPDEYGIIYIGPYLVDALDVSKTHYEIKQGTRWIGAQAFDDLNNSTLQTEVIVPQGVEIIDSWAFSTTNYGTEYSSLQITLPSTVKEIRYCAFANIFGDNSSVTLNEGLKIMGWSCFDQSRLTALTIPSTVEEIGGTAFSRMYELDTLTVLATTPPKCGENILNNSKASCVIKVPSSSVAAYQAAEGWSTYASKIQAI